MKLEKLKNASLDELRVRAAQRFAALSERRGWSSLAKLPNDEALVSLFNSADGRATNDLLEYFSSRSKPTFFASFKSPEKTAAELKLRWPTTAQRLIEKADRICDGQFDLLGFTGLSFGDPIDWHLEPISGKRIPLLHWSQLDYLDAEIAGDKKIIWELNRQQYFMTLGQAYWLTRAERYARVFTRHLEDWMDANPPKLGINWASSLEVAFRSMSWLWAFYFFKSSPSLSTVTVSRAWKFLYLNARHLESYLSTYFSPNTHLTGEALGLFYLGTLLPEFKEAKRWQDLGSNILTEQLPVHVRPDGVYFEQSSYYHRYTTDFYVHFLLLSRANNFIIPDQVEKYLALLLDHLMYLTRPDGTTPLFGDDDGGRLAMLDVRAANDFRATLATGAVLFDRGDYKFVAGDTAEQLLWLTGVEGLNRFDSLGAAQPSETSKPFSAGGYFVMRDGWTRESNYLLFDCGPHGSLASGHAHADALSIDVAANGRTLLVDPGTYTYTGSKELRDWFRSSQAHNTVTLDGESSSVPNTAFSWKSKANCSLQKWVSKDRFDFASGQHDGFTRLQDPALLTRSILFLKRDYWIVRDVISSLNEHRAEVRFHFDSSASASMPLDIKCFGDGRWIEEDGWISHCYGEKQRGKTLVFTTTLKGNQEIISFLLPQQTGIDRDVVEIEEPGGRAFAIYGGKTTDLVIIRSGERFEWLWIRFVNEQLQEIVSPQNDTGQEVDLSDPYLSALILGIKNYVRH
jgi:Heparinase II/III-like protein/Heparinase II/III N-terminus